MQFVYVIVPRVFARTSVCGPGFLFINVIQELVGLFMFFKFEVGSFVFLFVYCFMFSLLMNHLLPIWNRFSISSPNSDT